MAMLGQFLRVPRNFESFHDSLFHQVWGTTLPLKIFKDFNYWRKIGELMQSNMEHIAIKMAMLD